MKYFKCIYLTIYLLSHFVVNAQKLRVVYHFYPNENKNAISDKIPDSFNSKKQLKEYLQSLQKQLINEGYLAAGLDSIHLDSTQTKVYFYIGNKYTLAKLNKGNVPESILSEIGFRERFYYNKPFSPNQINKLFEKTITYLENNGYPFAQISLDSVIVANNEISASLHLNKGQFYTIDSVRIKGYKDFPKFYLFNQIKLKEGEPYNEKHIREIEQNIAKIPFLTLAKSPEILFLNDNCFVTLELKRKKSSKFDGIIGFLSDRETGKLSFTGDLKFKLINALKRAETIEFNYKGMPNSTQKLIASASIPYMFRTPFGAGFDINLFKKDTTFISVQTKLQADYLLSANRAFSVFFENKSTSLLAQSYLQNLTALPNYADVSSKSAGVSFLLNSTNDIVPSKGWLINIQASAGNRSVAKNPNINENLYQNLALSSNIYAFEWNIEKYFTLKGRHVILLKNQSAQLINNQLFENELFRIGGFSLLRGFNEESIFTSMYSIQTIEYHFLLEQRSYLLLFCDAGYYEKRIVNSFTHDTPYSFGAGITFETKAGIFRLIYALGSQLGNPVDVKGTKVHFGFVNYF